MVRKLFAAVIPFLMLVAAENAVAGAETGPQVRIGRVPDGAQMIDAKNGPNQSIHLLFQKNNAPCYAVSTDGGKTVSAPMPIITARINPPARDVSRLGHGRQRQRQGFRGHGQRWVETENPRRSMGNVSLDAGARGQRVPDR